MSNEITTPQPALEQLGDTLQKAVNGIFQAGGVPGKKVKNFLNGVWLGHALHPVLTDVPVGCWTVTVALDLLSGAKEDSELAAGADAALGLGILGAFGAAVAGITDWSDTVGEERHTGLIHMLLNVGGLSAFSLSWLLRRNKGQRKLAVAISTAAYGLTAYSAYLGGELVFKLGSMVNHNAWAEAPTEWTPVLDAAELPENQLYKAEANGSSVLLVKQDNRIYALNETCSHAGGPLSEGQLDGDTVICPWHGSRFCLKDGKVIDGPATYKVPSYEVRQQSGKIEIRLVSDQ
jgi:nitrite reductase/ring-hydroxylating ferredoxin subunit/uncharacterized membrane protein